MTNKTELFTDILSSVFGISVGISQIESILGIVILCVQCAYILYRCIYNIVTSIKNKKYTEIGKSILEFEEELTELLDKLREQQLSETDEVKLQEIGEKISKVESMVNKING